MDQHWFIYQFQTNSRDLQVSNENNTKQHGTEQPCHPDPGYPDQSQPTTCQDKPLPSLQHPATFAKEHKLQLQAHPESTDSLNTCQFCSKTFSTVRGLKRHRAFHAASCPLEGPERRDGNVAGNYTDRKKACKQNLHKGGNVSVTEEKFRCQTCGESFQTKSQLSKHGQLHRDGRAVKRKPGRPVKRKPGGDVAEGEEPGSLCCNSEGLVFQCEHCPSSFPSQEFLLQHVSQVHAGDGGRPFQCQACSATFTTASHLKTHIRSHSTDSPFQCEHCGLVCSHSEQLHLHVLEHTQHKPFKCSICSLAFTRASYLTVHMRNVHTGEKPHKCSQCGATYADVRNLKVHIRKHTGESGKNRHRDTDGGQGMGVGGIWKGGQQEITWIQDLTDVVQNKAHISK